MRLLPLLLLLALAAPADEVPRHDLVFEKWVRDTFFDAYKPSTLAQRWDIPATANKDHGGIPVNLALVRHGAAVDLGDALRQYEIDEPFLLLLGFWQQEAETKRVVNLLAAEISPQLWRKLWGQVTYNDLLKLDRLIRDPARPIEELRRLALQLKNAPPFTSAVIQVNPRIGTDGQRRLQCSIRFADIFTHLAPGADPRPQEDPALWGVKFPGPIASPPRERD